MPPAPGDLRLMLVIRFREWKRSLVRDSLGLATPRLGPHGGLGWKLLKTTTRRPCRWVGPRLRGVGSGLGSSLCPIKTVAADGLRPRRVAPLGWPLGDGNRSGPGDCRFPVSTGRSPFRGPVTHMVLRTGWGVLPLALLALLHTFFVVCCCSMRLFVLDMAYRACRCAAPIHTHTRTHTANRVVSWGPDGAPRIARCGSGWVTAHRFPVAAGRGVSPRGTGDADRGPGGWSPP